jgi:hemoglobin-like flavoprotein
MTPIEIELVKSSWLKVFPIAEKVAELFYGRLFEIAPEVKPLFKSDMKEQGRKLMQMLNTAVGSLDNLGVILPAVKDLGARHADYGVTDEHYDAVGEALLWTLEQGLGAEFTEEVEAAWKETYFTLADVMKAAAEEAAAA